MHPLPTADMLVPDIVIDFSSSGSSSQSSFCCWELVLFRGVLAHQTRRIESVAVTMLQSVARSRLLPFSVAAAAAGLGYCASDTVSWIEQISKNHLHKLRHEEDTQQHACGYSPLHSWRVQRATQLSEVAAKDMSLKCSSNTLSLRHRRSPKASGPHHKL